MSQSIRFLGLAVLTWAGVRAISLGLVPGAGALAFDLPVARTAQRPQLVPPVRPTTFPAIEPLGEASQPVVSAASYPAEGTMAPYPAFAPVPVYIYLSAQAPRINYPDVHYVFQAPPALVQQQASVEAEAITPRAPMEPGIVPVLRVVQRTPGLD